MCGDLRSIARAAVAVCSVAVVHFGDGGVQDGLTRAGFCAAADTSSTRLPAVPPAVPPVNWHGTASVPQRVWAAHQRGCRRVCDTAVPAAQMNVRPLVLVLVLVRAACVVVCGADTPCEGLDVCGALREPILHPLRGGCVNSSSSEACWAWASLGFSLGFVCV